MKLIDQEAFGRHIDERLFSVTAGRNLSVSEFLGFRRAAAARALERQDAAAALDPLENIFAILVREKGLKDEETRHLLDLLARLYDETDKLSYAATAAFFALQGLLQSNQGDPEAEVSLLDEIAKFAARSIDLKCGFEDAVDVYLDAMRRVLDAAIRRTDNSAIIECAGKVVTFCEAYALERDIDLSHALADQSSAFTNLRDHERAANAADRALVALSNATGDHDEFQALCLANLGAARLAQGRVPEAELALHKAAAIAESLFGLTDERARSLHRLLGEAAMKLGNVTAAKDHFMKSINVADRSPDAVLTDGKSEGGTDVYIGADTVPDQAMASVIADVLTTLAASSQDKEPSDQDKEASDATQAGLRRSAKLPSGFDRGLPVQTKTENILLPESVIRHILAKYGEAQFARIVRGALQNVITSTPPHRIAMMQAALPVLDSEQLYAYPNELPGEASKNFFEFCRTMHLNAEVLLAGSMLFLLGMAEPPKDLPGFDDVCAP